MAHDITSGRLPVFLGGEKGRAAEDASIGAVLPSLDAVHELRLVASSGTRCPLVNATTCSSVASAANRRSSDRETRVLAAVDATDAGSSPSARIREGAAASGLNDAKMAVLRERDGQRQHCHGGSRALDFVRKL